MFQASDPKKVRIKCEEDLLKYIDTEVDAGFDEMYEASGHVDDMLISARGGTIELDSYEQYETEYIQNEDTGHDDDDD